MHALEVERCLVKSPPELWSVCSDAAALARHLHGFGELRILRLEDEHTVAWEGDRMRGTVELEASGWGTRVKLTAAPTAAAPGPTAPASFPPRQGRSGRAGVGATLVDLILGRLGRLRSGAAPAPASPPATDVLAGLEAALDSLGAAHHRPYSRT